MRRGRWGAGSWARPSRAASARPCRTARWTPTGPGRRPRRGTSAASSRHAAPTCSASRSTVSAAGTRGVGGGSGAWRPPRLTGSPPRGEPRQGPGRAGGGRGPRAGRTGSSAPASPGFNESWRLSAAASPGSVRGRGVFIHPREPPAEPSPAQPLSPLGCCSVSGCLRV